MSVTDTQYRDRIRQLLDDGATSHRVAPDPLTEQVDGTRKAFILSNRNVISSSVKTSTDGGTYTTTGLTVDDATMGLISLSSAPLVTLEAVYYYQFFSDTEIDLLRDAGVSKTGTDPSDSAARAAIAQGLFTAACHLPPQTVAEFWLIGSPGCTRSLPEEVKTPPRTPSPSVIWRWPTSTKRRRSARGWIIGATVTTPRPRRRVRMDLLRSIFTRLRGSACNRCSQEATTKTL